MPGQTGHLETEVALVQTKWLLHLLCKWSLLNSLHLLRRPAVLSLPALLNVAGALVGATDSIEALKRLHRLLDLVRVH